MYQKFSATDKPIQKRDRIAEPPRTSRNNKEIGCDPQHQGSTHKNVTIAYSDKAHT